MRCACEREPTAQSYAGSIDVIYSAPKWSAPVPRLLNELAPGIDANPRLDSTSTTAVPPRSCRITVEFHPCSSMAAARSLSLPPTSSSVSSLSSQPLTSRHNARALHRRHRLSRRSWPSRVPGSSTTGLAPYQTPIRASPAGDMHFYPHAGR